MAQRRSLDLIPLRLDEPAATARSLLASVVPEELTEPLDVELSRLCTDMATLVGADVVSVYVREATDVDEFLTLRGNVGLSSEVVGNLRLHIGEGVVGWAAECLRPLTTCAADRDLHFKPVRGIGEERFPVMLAHPIIRHGTCRGVLVFQRGGAQAFDDKDRRLAGVLADTLGLVLAAADRQRHDDVGSEAVSLTGKGLTVGLGIGRAELMPTVESLPREPLETSAIEKALARVEREMGKLESQLGPDASPAARSALERLALIVADQRFVEEVLSGPGRLHTLARDYARAPFRQMEPNAGPDQTLVQKAEDVGELCAMLHVIATNGRLLQDGRVWAGRRLGGFAALLATRSAAAIVLDGGGKVSPEALAITRAVAVPLVVGVRNLFSWLRPDDLLVVDAELGQVRLNPSYSAILAARSNSR